MKLTNKVAIITGASKGLGKEIAKRFAREGAVVCLCARNVELLRAVQFEIMAMGGKSIFEQTNITDEHDIKAFISSCASSFGRVHILVNNASILGERIPIADYPRQEWEKVIAVNLSGTFLMVKHALPLFGNEGGSIINLSSSVGRIGKPNWGAYGVSKFGIEGLTQELAEELRSRNIRVNSVNPGPMATEMRRQAYPDEKQSALKKPADVTDIFVYLASDDSKNISGKTLDAQSFGMKK
jgi:NAD(P)-dependent dehydrogenase (short-subunit alcohol dehydrogenase family)